MMTGTSDVRPSRTAAFVSAPPTCIEVMDRSSPPMYLCMHMGTAAGVFNKSTS